MKRPIKIALAILLVIITVAGSVAFSRVRNNRLNEALFQAAVANDVAKVQSLLDQEADVNAREPRWNSTVLSYAAAQGSDEVVKVLLDHGADINATNRNGLTPLIDAAMSGRASTVHLLLSKGANAKVKNTLGKTALDEAEVFQRVTSGKPQRLSGGRDYNEVIALLKQAQ